MLVTSGSFVDHIRIALWVSASSGSTSVTHFQPCGMYFLYTGCSDQYCVYIVLICWYSILHCLFSDSGDTYEEYRIS